LPLLSKHLEGRFRPILDLIVSIFNFLRTGNHSAAEHADTHWRTVPAKGAFTRSNAWDSHPARPPLKKQKKKPPAPLFCHSPDGGTPKSRPWCGILRSSVPSALPEVFAAENGQRFRNFSFAL